MSRKDSQLANYRTVITLLTLASAQRILKTVLTLCDLSNRILTFKMFIAIALVA